MHMLPQIPFTILAILDHYVYLVHNVPRVFGEKMFCVYLTSLYDLIQLSKHSKILLHSL